MNIIRAIVHSCSLNILVKSVFASIIFTFGAFCFLTGKAQAQDGEVLFKQTCSACHTVGGGRIVGPDLIGISDKRSESWLLNWIKSSQTMIKGGDADAVALFEQFNKIMMPDNNLPDGDIKAILTFIKSKSGTPAVATTVVSGTAPGDAAVVINTANATESDILLGQQLFEGRTRMINGGAACVSCHHVNSNRVIPGGNLAKDLTTSHSRLGGDAGISGILNAPPFPAMTQTYKNKALTNKEIFALTSFLATVEKESATIGQPTLLAGNPLLLWGGIGFLIWLGFVLIIWNSRKRNTVKLKIFERQVKSI